MPYLIINKDSMGYRVVKFSNSIRIGRAEDNDIVLNDPNEKVISRHHAYIDQKKGVYTLYDRSSNGTTVENEYIKEYQLSHNVTFQIIDYFFTFIEDSEAESIERKPPNRGDKAYKKDESFDETVTEIIKKPSVELQPTIDLKKRLKKEGIIVESEKMMALYKDIREIAGINVPVLIFGESGSGKEKVAHTLHVFSKAKGDFIALNCSSIPEGIFESELFGSVKGAFHDAEDKPGKLELANNGTVFFDEIGDMNLSLQPKLLRFLEHKMLTRLGDTMIKNINVRVLAATNKDLLNMVKEKMFRHDFYQRLACIKLHIPPLRERKEDILPLAYFFLSKFSKEHNLKVHRISDEAKKMLLGYYWPGNVRELSNILLSASVRCRGNAISPTHLSAASEEIQMSSRQPVKEEFLSMKDIEKKHIKEALERTNWNKADAAKLLEISRDTLYKKIKKYNISKK